MNNWRLLLLAVVAVFQPIASFTDSNLIDGRQQCCDRLSTAPLQDTRSLLHGTYRLGKTTSALRRLNDRDETREDRRYELRQRVSISSRPSSERPLVDIRGRIARQSPSDITRSSRVEFRLERSAISHSRERLLDVNQREETARSTRDLQTQDLTRRVVDRTSNDALERRNVRIYTESPRNSLFRNDYRIARFGNDHLSKNLLDTQREMQREQFRSVERIITLNTDARRVVSRTQDDVPSIEVSSNMNNQRIARERLSAVRRESIIRPDTRRNSERNDEYRHLQRNNQQRRSLTENTLLVDRIRDLRIRLYAREDNRENRQRDSSNQRLSTERFDERLDQREERSSRQQNKENIERSTSTERRMQVVRGITSESRIKNVMTTQNERKVDIRQEIRHKRMSREIQDEIRENPDHRLSRERILLMDRRHIRESRIMNDRNKRDVADERVIRHNERMTRETQDENRVNREEALSRERIQMGRKNIREPRMMKAQNKREIDGRREIRHNERMTSEIRDENRENRGEALSRERTQMDQRNIRESRIMNSQNTRDVTDRREIRHIERMTRETPDENREIRGKSLSRQRIQMDRKNTRDSRNTNTRNVRNEGDRREIRHSERITRDEKENLINRLSVERTQIDRSNIREIRVINNLISRDDRRMDSKRETKFNNRMSRETQDENSVNPDHRLPLDRIQMERRNIREFRTVNTPKRLTRETQEEMRESPDRRFARESRQIDRRNIRDSKINRVATRNERSVETDTANRREINERLSGPILGDQINRERRVETKSAGRVMADHRDNSMMNRRARSVERRNFREIRAEPRLSRSTRSERRNEVFRSRVEHRDKIESSEREAIDARSRSVEMSINRERISSVKVGEMETENDYTVANWQYVLYTLQAAYLCSLFMQMLTPSHTEKSHKMSLRWLPVSSHYNSIKAD